MYFSSNNDVAFVTVYILLRTLLQTVTFYVNETDYLLCKFKLSEIKCSIHSTHFNNFFWKAIHGVTFATENVRRCIGCPQNGLLISV